MPDHFRSGCRFACTNFSPSSVNTDLPAGASTALYRALAILTPNASTILLREPFPDLSAPLTADLDLLVVGDVDDLIPERIFPSDSNSGQPLVDVLWLPERIWQAPEQLAAYGLIAHRTLGSRVVFDRNGDASERLRQVKSFAYQHGVQEARIAALLEMGYLVVREIGVTWDFPAMARFWLHIAYASCISAVADALGILCPNAYTKPLEAIRQVGLRPACHSKRTLSRACVLTVKSHRPQEHCAASLRRLTGWAHPDGQSRCARAHAPSIDIMSSVLRWSGASEQPRSWRRTTMRCRQ